MKKQVTVILAIAIITAAVYGCSSPPICASQKGKVANSFTPTAVEPMCLVALPTLGTFVTDVPNPGKAMFIHSIVPTISGQIASKPAIKGLAIRQRKAGGHNTNGSIVKVSIEHETTYLHVDPGLMTA